MASSILQCSACVRRAFQGLTPSAGIVKVSHAATYIRRSHPRIALAIRTKVTVATDPASRDLYATTPPQKDPSRAKSLDLKAGEADGDAAKAEVSSKEQRDRQKLRLAVQKQKQFVGNDPWKVAQYVERALKRDAFDEALEVVRDLGRESKGLVVAWNHLIDYTLQKQRIKTALKLFNDMKKRGERPNVQTFTILFRGFANSEHPKFAVDKAVKYYTTLVNDKRLTPNSIHMNAVLHVCARARDVDAMWTVLDISQNNKMATTAHSYTSILSALRHSSQDGMKDLTPDQRAANLTKLLHQAKSLWQEVIRQWHQGKLVMDEKLVCEMGRLLLLSPKTAEKRQVFDLLEQTMDITNRLKNPSAGETPLGESEESSDLSLTPKEAASAKKSLRYAQPDRSTLALIMTALSNTGETIAGIKYWNLLVHRYEIEPDMDIWMRLFGLLRLSKSSGHASTSLSLIPTEFTKTNPRFFRMAMSTCIRDSINPNAMKNANTTLDTMLERMPNPDLETLRLYLRVALVNHAHFRNIASQEGRLEEAKRMYGTQITEALARLWEPYKQAFYHYFTAADRHSAQDTEKGLVYNGKCEVIALARHMTSAFDKVKNEAMLPEEDLRDLKPIHAKITREIQNFFKERELHEPNLPSARSAKSDSKRKSDIKENADETAVESDDAGAKSSFDTLSNSEKDFEDEFAIRQGPEWVWDTYKGVRSEGAGARYPWEPKPANSSMDGGTAIFAPSRSRRAGHNSKRTGSGSGPNVRRGGFNSRNTGSDSRPRRGRSTNERTNRARY